MKKKGDPCASLNVACWVPRAGAELAAKVVTTNKVATGFKDWIKRSNSREALLSGKSVLAHVDLAVISSNGSYPAAKNFTCGF